jgi:fibronectin type 3 domain-containing protein
VYNGPSPPASPAAATGSPGIVVGWAGIGSNSTVNIYRSTVSGGEISRIASGIELDVNTYTDLTTTAGVTYYYKLTGVNQNGGEGAMGSEVSAVSG